MATIDDLGQRFWDAAIGASPTWATLLGDHRFDDQIEDFSVEAEDRLIATLDEVAAAAEALDPGGLDQSERISRGVLMFEAASQADQLRSRTEEYNVDPQLGWHVSLFSFAPQFPIAEPDHAEAMLVRFGKIGTAFGQLGERLRQGVANGRTPPRIACEKVIAQIDEYLASPVDSDPFLQTPAPPAYTESEAAAFRDHIAVRVRTVIRPAYAGYRDAVAAVLPAARPPEKSGLVWLPDGEEVYERAVRRYTSTGLTAREVHQIGLDEIESMGREYRALGASVLGTADLAEIYVRLRDDPALRFKTAADVKAQAERALARAEAAIPDWFGRLPKAGCVVEPIPDVAAPDSTLAYYLPPATDGTRPGTYFINLYQPETRTVYESEALAFHESIPGHHLQLAISQEVEDLPEFRKHGLVTAYVEGWGLYTERLSDEMGLYSGDLERMGILSFDSWRAGRLVVDTGMHALGWSRRQAIDYFTENSPQAPNNIENEVDRYIGWPGQALAYKIGQREILRLRARAEDALGDRFDIKAFHDVVLETGAVPLELLATVVDEWIASR